MALLVRSAACRCGRPAAARGPSACRPVRAGGAAGGWKSALPRAPLPQQPATVVRAWCLAVLDRPPSARRRSRGCRSSCCRLTVASVTTLWVVMSRDTLLFGAGGSSHGGIVYSSTCEAILRVWRRSIDHTWYVPGLGRGRASRSRPLHFPLLQAFVCPKCLFNPVHCLGARGLNSGSYTKLFVEREGEALVPQKYSCSPWYTRRWNARRCLSAWNGRSSACTPLGSSSSPAWSTIRMPSRWSSSCWQARSK